MKMPEKHDLLWPAIHGKGAKHQAILAFAMAYLRGAEYNGGAFTKQ